MKRVLLFDNLAKRHPGVSPGIGQCYEEAASVCLARHHISPATFSIRDNQTSSQALAVWRKPNDALCNAWANDIDTTEAGGYAVALATVEVTRGLVAIRRAETRTGADYYLNEEDSSPDDLETAIRLEVSGSAAGSLSVLETRLKQKLAQAEAGDSNLPAMAVVVGFEQLVVLSSDMSVS